MEIGVRTFNPRLLEETEVYNYAPFAKISNADEGSACYELTD